MYFISLVFFFLFSILAAHDGSYEMNYENFIANNQGFSTNEVVLTAKVVKRDTYSELLFYNQDGAKVNFEFNNYFRDSMKSSKHFSVSTWGWYNTISYKSGDIAYLWHGNPSMRRSNDGFGEISNSFFESIIATGTLEYLIEKNWRYFHYNAVANSVEFSADEFPEIPSKYRVFKITAKIDNPEAIAEFLKVPFDYYLPFDFRKKFRIVRNKLIALF